jgi:hypothetical protein
MPFSDHTELSFLKKNFTSVLYKYDPETYHIYYQVYNILRLRIFFQRY